MEKNQPAVQETQVQSLGWEDPLEKGIATHSSILAWRIPWTEEPGSLQSRGSRRVRHGLATNTTQTTFIFPQVQTLRIPEQNQSSAGTKRIKKYLKGMGLI